MNELTKEGKQDILNLRDTIKIFRELGCFDEQNNTYSLDGFKLVFSKVNNESFFNIYVGDSLALEYSKMDDIYFTTVKNILSHTIYLSFLNSKLLSLELPAKSQTTITKRIKI